MVQHYEAEVALRLTMDMVANLVENWHEANAENRRTLANGLFEYLVYDLDAQQIVDFKLKPWIELLMQLKVTLDTPMSQMKAAIQTSTLSLNRRIQAQMNKGIRGYSGAPGGLPDHIT